MAKEKKSKGAPANHTGRPTGSYSNYATSGYGYGGSGAYGGRSPYGASAQQPHAANANANGNAHSEKADVSDKAHMSRKDKKLAKRAKKFDETDLRCYPMTIRAWIGTFILLALPFVGGICAICWFFGVGNKSRTSWIRSYVVIWVLIVLILGIFLGVGYSVLANNAKQVDLSETYGEEYGTLGDYGFMGTVYYVACKAVDLLEDQLGGPEATDEVKAMLAQKLLGIGEENPDEGNVDENGNGGEHEFEFEEQYA